MKKKINFKFNTDRLLAILAFLISVCTLYVFFYQTALMKKQQYASVLPFLAMGNTQLNGDYNFILSNNGIGPAFIEEINVYYNDSIYKNMDVNDFFTDVIIKEDTLLNSQNITHATISKGMLIPEKDTKIMMKLSNKANSFDVKHYRLRDWLNNKIKIEIRYSSVYGEKWKIIYPETEAPIRVK